MKFMLNTKVLAAEKKDGKVFIKTEAAKGGKEDTVSVVVAVACSSHPTTFGLA